MIIGNPACFAIESRINKPYERLSFLALGFFVIYVNGRRYGVYKPDASMLACSYREVEDRIAARGMHVAPFASRSDASAIAISFRDALYAENQAISYLGIETSEFSNLFYSNHLIWAPDGDEAFNDSSYVLQFDVMDSVRLVAFTSAESFHYDSGTLNEVWISAEEYYSILQKWHDAFQSEWETLPKHSE